MTDQELAALKAGAAQAHDDFAARMGELVQALGQGDFACTKIHKSYLQQIRLWIAHAQPPPASAEISASEAD